jgi:hypothetical protein
MSTLGCWLIDAVSGGAIMATQDLLASKTATKPQDEIVYYCLTKILSRLWSTDLWPRWVVD